MVKEHPTKRHSTQTSEATIEAVEKAVDKDTEVELRNLMAIADIATFTDTRNSNVERNNRTNKATTIEETPTKVIPEEDGNIKTTAGTIKATTAKIIK